MNESVDPERLLRLLVERAPGTLAELEAIVGSLTVDPDKEWFALFRPGFGEGAVPAPDGLSSISVTLDPYRTEIDPPIETYRIGFAVSFERALAIVDDAAQCALRRHQDGTFVDWTAQREVPAAVPCDLDVRRAFLAALPLQLADVRTAPELAAVLARPPDGAGITSTAASCFVHRGLELVSARMPRVELVLDPPHDVRELCALWNVRQPIGTSSDMHQSSWHVSMRGEDVPDPHGQRVASDPIMAGPWWMRPQLAARPGGPLPDVACGGSSAYDLEERGGLVARIAIERVAGAAERGQAPGVTALAGPLLLYDGTCGLCARSVRWILRKEADHEIRFAPLQGETAAAARARFGHIPTTLDSVVYIEGERAHLRSKAFLHLMKHMRAPWRWGYHVRWLPGFVLDLGYRVVAATRYRLFGKVDACELPSPDQRARFLP